MSPISTPLPSFIKAIEKYKQESGKLFPSWTEVLKIFKELGYKKVAKRPESAKTNSKAKAVTAVKTPVEATEATT